MEDSSGPLEAGCDKLRGGHQRRRGCWERWRRATGATSYNAAISLEPVPSLRRSGRQWQRALALVEEMHSLRLQADVITYAATISACEKGGQWQRALGLFEEFRSHGLQANVITYNATISACEKGAGKGSAAWRCSRRCTCWAAGLR